MQFHCSYSQQEVITNSLWSKIFACDLTLTCARMQTKICVREKGSAMTGVGEN